MKKERDRKTGRKGTKLLRENNEGRKRQEERVLKSDKY